jgi:peptidoglycan-N-acetylglucosamine deacetylase
MIVPHRTPFFLPLLYPSSLIWRIPTNENELYLTFDDGPVNGPTEFVLEELARRNVHGTFFCIGDNVMKHTDVFRKIKAAGHGIGNHTFNHLNGWKAADKQYLENIDQCEKQIGESGGRPVSIPLFRPPYGRIKRSQIKALSKYRIVMWDVLSIDYDKSLSPERCLKNSIAATRPGSIVVFHDSFKAERNLSHALPRFLDHFLSKGYQFKLFT